MFDLLCTNPRSISHVHLYLIVQRDHLNAKILPASETLELHKIASFP